MPQNYNKRLEKWASVASKWIQKKQLTEEEMSVHNKVWGREEWIVNTPLYCMKKLYLHKGYKCSMHHHKIKDETFIIETGAVGMELDGVYRVMLPGDKIHVPPNTEHRFWGLEHSSIVEVSTQHLEEDSYRSEPSGKIGCEL